MADREIAATAWDGFGLALDIFYELGIDYDSEQVFAKLREIGRAEQASQLFDVGDLIAWDEKTKEVRFTRTRVAMAILEEFRRRGRE